MTALQPGDRIRVVLDGEDGLPLVRYGWVGGVTGSGGPVVVMLDGELGGDLFDPLDVELVTVTSLELTLQGLDLVEDDHLRRGLVAMWQAEAEQAGLDVDGLHCFGAGVRDSSEGWALGEVVTGGASYVLRASTTPNEPGIVRVRADRPNRWDV